MIYGGLGKEMEGIFSKKLVNYRQQVWEEMGGIWSEAEMKKV